MFKKVLSRYGLPAKQIAEYIAKFDQTIAKLVRAARTIVRKRFPTAIELVYDNYNALAIGYSTIERTSDVLFSLAVYARGVNLYFMYGRYELFSLRDLICAINWHAGLFDLRLTLPY